MLHHMSSDYGRIRVEVMPHYDQDGCHATSQLSMERLVSKSHSINVTTHDMLCRVICQVSLEGFMLRSRNFKVTTDVRPHVR